MILTQQAEQIRKRYLYRRLVLCGDARISRETARKMLGPDCAYQLYGKTWNHGQNEKNRTKDPRVKRKMRMGK